MFCVSISISHWCHFHLLICCGKSKYVTAAHIKKVYLIRRLDGEVFQVAVFFLKQTKEQHRALREQGTRCCSVYMIKAYVTLKVSKLKGLSLEAAILELYRHRERSVEESASKCTLSSPHPAGGKTLPNLREGAKSLWAPPVN